MPATSPRTAFGELGLRPQLLTAVEAAGYREPTPVQVGMIAAVLAGRDVLARAATGSGKTAAFALPLLQGLLERSRPRATRGNPVAVLVLCPTRELGVQIADVFTGFSRSLGARIQVLAVHGGVKINPQMMALRGGVDVLVATPGRLLELCACNAVDLATLRVLVLDEADRMLGEGFRDELTQVLSHLPVRRQTLLLSATFPEPMAELARRLLHRPHEVDAGEHPRAASDSPVAEPDSTPAIEQHVYAVDEAAKPAVLLQLLSQNDVRQTLVFVGEKRTADRLLAHLERAGVRAAAFHGDRSQGARTQALSDFRAGKLTVLLATDLAGRGLDIEGLPAVINFDLPRSPNDYLHRIGRTGRAGETGLALSLICPADEAHFRVIEKRMKQRLPREHVEGFEPRAAARPRDPRG